ncbi:uncharacterized protein PGTG_10551 [Puccinia graminis f. sp. tritici CRL 75-36-700-3]|uniref:Uncharacterized protein n=1 Tax=Puccinia graminis f. sp. tritici (strain CRL 75-36-700-3 / race SCCL) TaxID=418459 RepID=E3KIP8_PUCGT|nr:uncharacterized protein PGTG_10551 [Puccinia graminis f. sp. tritici CRL 75-36-700-3]EFP84173.1 hypothetical protein PGTG_10551 [Puccinia graminis f. sp. tritici CRL 75-36-700-3]
MARLLKKSEAKFAMYGPGLTVWWSRLLRQCNPQVNNSNNTNTNINTNTNTNMNNNQQFHYLSRITDCQPIPKEFSQRHPGKEKQTQSDVAKGSRAVLQISSQSLLSPTGKKEKTAINHLCILKAQKSSHRLSDMVGIESKQSTLPSRTGVGLLGRIDTVERLLQLTGGLKDLPL